MAVRIASQPALPDRSAARTRESLGCGPMRVRGFYRARVHAIASRLHADGPGCWHGCRNGEQEGNRAPGARYSRASRRLGFPESAHLAQRIGIRRHILGLGDVPPTSGACAHLGRAPGSANTSRWPPHPRRPRGGGLSGAPLRPWNYVGESLTQDSRPLLIDILPLSNKRGY